MKSKGRPFFFIYLLFWVAESSLSTYLGIIYERKGLDGMQIGLINSVLSISVIIASIIIGMIGDKNKNFKTLLGILCVGMLAGTGLLFVSKAVALIVIAVMIYGFFYAPFNGLMDQIVMNEIRDEPQLFGKIRTGGTVGAAVGVIITGAIVANGGYSFLFIPYWLGMAACLLMVQRIPKRQYNSETTRLRDYLHVLKHPMFLTIYGCFIMWGFTESSIMQFQAIHIVESGYSESLTSAFIFLSMIGEAATFILVPKIVGKLRYKKALAVAFTVQGLKILSLVLLGTIPVYMVGFFQMVGGGAYAIVYSILTDLISSQFPGNISCCAHTMKLVVNRGIGVSIGNLLLGFSYSRGFLSEMYMLFALVSLIYTLVICCSPKLKSLSRKL